jgi:hypothetical protein
MGTLSPEIGHFSHIKHMISKSWLGPTTNRFHGSNSKKIVDLLNQNKFEAIISERVIREALHIFKNTTLRIWLQGFETTFF